MKLIPINFNRVKHMLCGGTHIRNCLLDSLIMSLKDYIGKNLGRLIYRHHRKRAKNLIITLMQLKGDKYYIKLVGTLRELIDNELRVLDSNIDEQLNAPMFNSPIPSRYLSSRYSNRSKNIVRKNKEGFINYEKSAYCTILIEFTKYLDNIIFELSHRKIAYLLDLKDSKVQEKWLYSDIKF